MEHEIPFGTLRPGKKGRFPFNQNFRFEFLATSNSEWNSIFKNSQKWDNLVRYTHLIFEKIFRTLSFPSILLPEILKVWVEWVAFRDFSSFRNFWKLFGEISIPFAAVSKFSKVLVEWRPRATSTCSVAPGNFSRQQPKKSFSLYLISSRKLFNNNKNYNHNNHNF